MPFMRKIYSIITISIIFLFSFLAISAQDRKADSEALIESETAIFTLADFEECKSTMKFLVGGKLNVSHAG